MKIIRMAGSYERRHRFPVKKLYLARVPNLVNKKIVSCKWIFRKKDGIL